MNMDSKTAKDKYFRGHAQTGAAMFSPACQSFETDVATIIRGAAPAPVVYCCRPRRKQRKYAARSSSAIRLQLAHAPQRPSPDDLATGTFCLNRRQDRRDSAESPCVPTARRSIGRRALTPCVQRPWQRSARYLPRVASDRHATCSLRTPPILRRRYTQGGAILCV